MKHFPTLLSHELRMLLVGPATYVAATLLGFMGLIFTKILEIYSGAPRKPRRRWSTFNFLAARVRHGAAPDHEVPRGEPLGR